MKVSELAARAGTTAKTIRYYEAQGILPAPSRQENRYREYDEDDLCRVRLVLSLRGIGLGLAESGRLAAMCSTGRCGEMAGDFALRVAERRRAVAAAMAELRHLDAELASIERSLATGEAHPAYCLGSSTPSTAGA